MRAPWLNKTSSAYDHTTSTISQLLGRTSPKSGQVGLEIEVEGNCFPKPNEYDGDDMGGELIPPQWKYTHDGSLRGDDNAEYVINGIINFNEVPEALTSLWEMFNEFGSVLDESNRTSVHVHLNAQSWHLNRLASFLGLYFSVEEILTQWCGDHRAGNLFCLRAKDAPAIINRVRKFLKTGDFSVFDDGVHYSGVNLGALTKFGSVEIRCMRGATKPEPVLTWVSVLERIYNLSGEFTDPRLVVAEFSGNGPFAYLNFVLGDNTEQIVNECGLDNEQIVASLMEGIRFAQNVCYCRDWSRFDTSKTLSDPFGRTPKQLIESMNSPPVITSVPAPHWIDEILNYEPPQPAPTGHNSPQSLFAPVTPSVNNHWSAFYVPTTPEDTNETI